MYVSAEYSVQLTHPRDEFSNRVRTAWENIIFHWAPGCKEVGLGVLDGDEFFTHYCHTRNQIEPLRRSNKF